MVAGDGPLRARLERHAARLPVDFTGFISSRSTVATLLASADVALAPDRTKRSGWPHLEGAGVGTPVVVSRTSALSEILTADSGRCADNDPAAIAGAVAAVIDRPEPQRRFCARRRAESFSWPRSAAGMLTALGAHPAA